MNLKRSIFVASIAITAFGCAAEVAEDTDLATVESALTVSSNQTGTNNGFFFTFWKDGGSVNMTMPDAPAQYPGNYGVSWGSGTYNFVGGKGWNPGVIGIVAGRMKDKLHRPTIVIAEDEDGTGKGSGRSISGVDLGAAVLAAKDSGLLVAGGGHAMAAGLTVAPGGIEALRAFLCERLARDVEQAVGARALLLDAALAPGGVIGGLCDELDGGGPYGAGWPSPRIAAGPARLMRVGIVGNGHVRGLACGDDGKSFKWIAFRSAETPLGDMLLASPADKRWWLAGSIKRDEWNGGNAAEMHLDDAAAA